MWFLSLGKVALLSLTLVFAVIVNIALVVRFINWQAKWATRIALISAALHGMFSFTDRVPLPFFTFCFFFSSLCLNSSCLRLDITVIVILVAFSVQHHLTANSYYGEGYWTMLASSVFCFTVTMLLTFDWINSPYIKLNGICYYFFLIPSFYIFSAAQ